MREETLERRQRGLSSVISSERIKLTAPWEGAWPAKVANISSPGFVLLLRLTMGWIFVWAGFDKLIRGFSAEGFLLHATKGPFAGWFQSMGESQTALSIIEPMVVWGEIVIGVALIFGVMTRWAAFWGAVMMFMFFIAQLPPEHNPFMEYYLIYILVLGVIGALGAGRIVGLDNMIERLPLVRRIPGATFLLG